MIMASQAREMSGLTPRERVESIMPLIEKAAKAKGRRIDLHDEFWVNEGYSRTPAWKEAVVILEELGYKVEFFYNERQFVDMYTVVSW